MHLSLLLLIALALAPSSDARRTLNWQKYGSQILQRLVYSDAASTVSAFTFHAQNADATLVPLFKKFKHLPTSIFAPTNAAFVSYVNEQGGNMSDPKQQSTKEFKQKWNDQFEYFFINGTYLTTNLVAGETVLVDTYKKSPKGDWPLQFAIRRDEEIEEWSIVVNSTYNGTVYAAPGSFGNITFPDLDIPSWTTAQAIDFWPIQPISLTETIALLNVSNWESLQSALPSVLALDTQRDFTLFLPPSSAILTSLSLSSDGLSSFLNAHLVQNERILLTNATKSFTNVGGASLQATKNWVSVEGGRNATVLERDLLTNGGLIQLIDRSLYTFSNETNAGATRREEL